MNVYGQEVESVISTSEALREIVGTPSRYAAVKEIDHVDPLAERFIAASPLAILGTRRMDGGLDMAPRGDPPGFIKVLDSKTLAFPDRPGNNRMDAIENILRDNAVGLLVLIPGSGDTLRIRGKATVVRDSALSEKLAVNGRPAGLVILIQVERLYSHCPKAFIRSKAWKPEEWPDRSNVPSLAEMLEAHTGLGDPVAKIQEAIDHSNTERLY